MSLSGAVVSLASTFLAMSAAFAPVAAPCQVYNASPGFVAEISNAYAKAPAALHTFSGNQTLSIYASRNETAFKMRMDPDGGLSGPFKDLVNLYAFDFFGAFTILMPPVANEAKNQRLETIFIVKEMDSFSAERRDQVIVREMLEAWRMKSDVINPWAGNSKNMHGPGKEFMDAWTNDATNAPKLGGLSEVWMEVAARLISPSSNPKDNVWPPPEWKITEAGARARMIANGEVPGPTTPSPQVENWATLFPNTIPVIVKILGSAGIKVTVP